MAAKKAKKTTKKSRSAAAKKSNLRGSPEAVAKRRIARALNTVALGGGTRPDSDGRTEKRRLRLITELKEMKKGRRGTPLKPQEVLSRTQELIDLGESFASLKKAGVKPMRIQMSDELVEIIEEHAQLYKLDPQTWRMLGVKVDENGKVKR